MYKELTKPAKKVPAVAVPTSSHLAQGHAGWRHHTRQVSFVNITKDKHKTDPKWCAGPYNKDLAPPYFLNSLRINDTPISPATKTIKTHVCSATNPMALTRKLKMASTTLPTIAGNASAASPASVLSASANLSNHFLKPLHLFDEEPLPPPPPPSPKAPAMARKIVEIVTERAVRIEYIVMPCSWNKVRIFSAKDVFLSRTFSRVCLILATCVSRSFRFYESISSLAFFLSSSRLIFLYTAAFVY